MNTKFSGFDEFFLFYLRQHSHRANRRLHAAGTALGLAIAVAALLLHHPWFALLWVPVGYGFAWVGHLLVERNRPATWGHPWWSFLSDFRMMGLMLTGQLDAWMARADAAARRTQSAAAQD
jgi:hypothetical protein